MNTTGHSGLRIGRWALLLAAVWTVLVVVSYAWNTHQVHELLLDQARTELRANFFKDLTFRQWATNHGGVYVPVTETQKPDPYIAFIPERDVVTPSGRTLTLINPALMVRQFNELAREKYGAEGHLSGIQPLNPDNTPDPWERSAYARLQQGAEEVTEITSIKGAPYLRLIRPMVMGKECLKCHVQQGFKEGDFSGGISVSVALAPIDKLFAEKSSVLLGAHLLFWIAGISGIVIGRRQLTRRVEEREVAYAALQENEQRTNAIVANSLDAIITIDAAGIITGWNEQAKEIFGWHAAELVGKPLTSTIIPERYRRDHEKGVARALVEGGGPLMNRRIEITALRKSGVEFPVELSITAIYVEGQPAFSAFLRDISQRKQSEEKMLRDVITQSTVATVLEIATQPLPFVERLQLILKETMALPWLHLQAKGAVFVVGQDGRSLELVAQQGMEEDEVSRCQRVAFGDCFCGKAAEQHEALYKGSIDTDNRPPFAGMAGLGHSCLPIMSGERLLGVLHLYMEREHQRSDDESQLLSAVCNAIGGIIQRNEAEQLLRHNAYHDDLTGLPNRALLYDRLGQCLARGVRHTGYQFAVLFLDLDRFKVINDGLGHSVGDLLLTAVAQRLLKVSRPEDTVARLGGDEFTMLLDDIHSDADASRVAARIHEEMKLPFNVAGHEVFAPCSIGIAFGNDRYREPAEMMRDADTAMYRAKHQGGARSVIFGEKMHTLAVARLKMEAELRHALEHGELRVHYQPIVAAASGRIEGFEALARWPSGSSMISPADFIPVAEETGLISELGMWVLHEACLQLRRWQQTLPNCEDLYVSVNLSGRQLMQHDLHTSIETILEGVDYDPAKLRLEITESVLMDNAEASSLLIETLRKRGIRFYIDDFGTGYSSLSYLHSFPFDALKIDRSFVSKLERGAEHVKMVETIVAIAHNFGMKVVAEGVETAEELAQLRLLGAEYLQGYHFARPLSAVDAEGLLTGQTPIPAG